VLNFLQLSRDTLAQSAENHPSSRDEKATLAPPPLLVHCNAGAGRAGAFLLLDALTRLVDARQRLQPLELVRALRDQRMTAVQNDQQFRFVVQASLAYFDAKPKR